MRTYTAGCTKHSGFSLIELMIVVVIVGILASIALPAYSDYVRRARAADAVAQLSSYASRLEQFYLDNRNYGAGGCGIPNTNFRAEKYNISCELQDGDQGFLLTATAQIDNEGTYTVDEGGSQRTTVFKGSSKDAACWLIGGSEC